MYMDHAELTGKQKCKGISRRLTGLQGEQSWWEMAELGAGRLPSPLLLWGLDPALWLLNWLRYLEAVVWLD